MMTRKTSATQEKMQDIAKASSVINEAVKFCENWDHHEKVDQAIEKMREAQKLLKQQYEEWKKGGPGIRVR